MMKRLAALLWSALLIVLAAACGAEQRPSGEERWDVSPELRYDHSMELSYAEGFSVDLYEGGYALLSISGEGRYLVIPEGAEPVGELAGGVVPLRQPLGRMYLAASAAMDMFRALDALDTVRFSSLKEESWYLPEAREAMARGDILYAGAYSAPDYERILAEGCGLAIENTMIYHSPEVKEQLERFGVPVLVDRSSYEENPLGRMEWVKVYGLLTGREAAAQAVFDSQVEAFSSIGEADTGKTVAFFYITSTGAVNVRRSADYVPKMIEMAGGSYIFSGLGAEDGSASSTVTMQMEAFYAAARDADYVIYNSTVDGELASLDALTAKDGLLSNLKAVREGTVFCTAENLYQSSMELGDFILDLHRMLTGDWEHMTYLYKLE